MPALIRIAIMLGAAGIALDVMGRIEDPMTGQIVAVVIALAGVIVSRLVYAKLMQGRE